MTLLRLLRRREEGRPELELGLCCDAEEAEAEAVEEAVEEAEEGEGEGDDVAMLE